MPLIVAYLLLSVNLYLSTRCKLKAFIIKHRKICYHTRRQREIHQEIWSSCNGDDAGAGTTILSYLTSLECCTEQSLVNKLLSSQRGIYKKEIWREKSWQSPVAIGAPFLSLRWRCFIHHLYATMAQTHPGGDFKIKHKFLGLRIFRIGGF